MLLLEIQAFTKQCPILVGATKDPVLNDETACMGSQCMAWQWFTPPWRAFFTAPGMRPAGPGEWKLAVKRPERWTWTTPVPDRERKGTCGMVRGETRAFVENHEVGEPWTGDVVQYEVEEEADAQAN